MINGTKIEYNPAFFIWFISFPSLDSADRRFVSDRQIQSLLSESGGKPALQGVPQIDVF